MSAFYSRDQKVGQTGVKHMRDDFKDGVEECLHISWTSDFSLPPGPPKNVKLTVEWLVWSYGPKITLECHAETWGFG